MFGTFMEAEWGSTQMIRAKCSVDEEFSCQPKDLFFSMTCSLFLSQNQMYR